MEGISNEAASLAGHWGLGKLIAFYDDNQISIDGNTEISFTEDVSARYVALGWHVLHVKVGTLKPKSQMRQAVNCRILAAVLMFCIRSCPTCWILLCLPWAACAAASLTHDQHCAGRQHRH